MKRFIWDFPENIHSFAQKDQGMKAKVLFAGALTLVLAGACQIEISRTDGVEGNAVDCPVRLSADAAWSRGRETKSTLPSAGIETQVNEVVLAAYRDGLRFASGWFAAPFDSLSLRLYKGQRFHVYALANMGDLQERLPLREADLQDLTYRIGPYSGSDADAVSRRGIPMADRCDFTPGVQPPLTFQLKRLLARVTVNLECLWPGGHISRVGIRNMNGALKPFGDSAASDPADIYDGPLEEETLDGDPRSVQMVLYVPENLQGTIAGISDDWEKSQDYNSLIDERQDCLTYLEVEVSGSGLYEGTMTYRNYLGDNATDSFDIQRNTAYVWDIVYFEDNLCKDEWKYENDLDDRRTLSPDNLIEVCPGDTVTLGDHLRSNIPLERLCWMARGDGADIIQTVLNRDGLAQPNLVIRRSATPGQRKGITVLPVANPASRLRKDVMLEVVSPQELEFERVGSGDIFPYQRVVYAGVARYTESKAQELRDALSLSPLGDSLLPASGILQVCQDSDGYYLSFGMFPTAPGYYSFTVSGDRGSKGMVFIVRTPVLDAGLTAVHLDLEGNDKYLTWCLTDRQDNAIVPDVNGSQCRFTLSYSNPLGVQLHLASADNGSSPLQRYTLSLMGFDGLSGLDYEDYTFQGLTIPVTARFTYPNGYFVTSTVDLVIDNPLDSAFDGDVYAYRADMGASQTGSYVSASPLYYPEYMLDWPPRTITVDLSRGGTRSVPANLEIRKGSAGVLDLNQRWVNGAAHTKYDCINGSVSFPEDLTQWGALYYGKTLTNRHSGETVFLPHSILRLYDHYNVFATFDVRQDDSAQMGSAWGSMNWNWTADNQIWGCFRADWTANFSKGAYSDILNRLVVRTLTSEDRPAPVYPGFSRDTSAPDGQLAAYRYTSSRIAGYDGYGDYYLGYWNESRGYDIYYRTVKTAGVRNVNLEWELINWRVIMSANRPKFGIGSGGFGRNQLYCSALTKIRNRTYNFSILSKTDYENGNTAAYYDPDGLGYQYLHPFWEGRANQEYTLTSHLNAGKSPASRPVVYLVNGWYDPSLYYNAETPSKNGVPVTGTQVGMYFYDPRYPYYPLDKARNFESDFDAGNSACMSLYNAGSYITYQPLQKYRNSVETFDFGTLQERDRNAER